MRTYLVTGGAGFIGSNYIHYMFRKYDNEIRIINVDVLTYAGNLENLKDIENRDNYTFIKADICDREAIEKIFAENDIDRVVHFAAESHVDRSIRNPEVFVQTNVMGTAVMLNAAKKAWELPDGHLRLTRNSFMYLLMKYMVHYRMMIMPFSMRHHLSILIAHIRQARHPLICLLRHI